MDKIAVVGMAGVFPDANTPEELFDNLLRGKNSIHQFSEHELREEGVSEESFKNVDYRRFGSYIENVDRFDNEFFGMTPLESKLTDPQQRLFLTCAWQALENAGYSPANMNCKVGVFGSQSENMYLQKNIMNSDYYNPESYDYPILLGNNPDSLATRVSYKLNLKGPSLTIQSACSSSLVSLNYAMKSLDSDECEMALVGGSSLWFPQKSGYFYTNGSTFSNNGKIRPFDNGADGMIRGSGCAVVVIKKITRALQDRDHIYGIIEGLGINNDGNEKIGYTAPSIKGESDAIKLALSQAQVSPKDICYIEAHGTGTLLGDPIELRALSKNYSRTDKTDNPIRIGSIKANIGHLDVASGLTGLIKSLLIMDKHIIPQQINFSNPNKNFDFERNGFLIDTNNHKLNRNSKHFVSFTSLGIGGTNVHGIVSSYKNSYSPADKEETVLIPLSARNHEGMIQMCLLLSEYLDTHRVSILDVAYTLSHRLSELNVRQYFIAKSTSELSSLLKDYILTNNYKGAYSKVGAEWMNSGNISTILMQCKEGYRIPLPSRRFVGSSFWIRPNKIQNQKDSKKSRGKEKPIDIVLDVWEKNIGRPVSPNEDFFQIGGESLTAVSIIAELSTEFKIDIDPNLIEKYSTPNLLSEYINEKAYPIKNTFENIVLLHKGTSDNNLFLIHPAGGSIFCYRKLLKNILTDFNIYGISFPSDINSLTSISNLAKMYAEQINKIKPEGKLVLGGYSFGGNEALQVVSELKKMGRNVTNVVMIDSIVPEAYSEAKLTDNEYVERFPEIWQYIVGDSSDKQKVISHEMRKNNLDEMIKIMRAENRLPENFSDEMIKRMFNIWVSNHKILAHQNLVKGLDVSVTLFYATEALSEDTYSFTKMKPYLPKQWEKYCNFLKVIEIEGNHYSIFGDSNKLLKLKSIFENELQIISESINNKYKEGVQNVNWNLI